VGLQTPTNKHRQSQNNRKGHRDLDNLKVEAQKINKKKKKKKREMMWFWPDMVTHTCNSSIWEGNPGSTDNMWTE
jgi:hypothetical protein